MLDLQVVAVFVSGLTAFIIAMHLLRRFRLGEYRISCWAGYCSIRCKWAGWSNVPVSFCANLVVCRQLFQQKTSTPRELKHVAAESAHGRLVPPASCS